MSRWWVYIALVKSADVPGKNVVWKAADVAVKSVLGFSALMLPTQKKKGALNKNTELGPELLDFLLTTVWMLLFLFGPKHTMSIPSSKALEY